ncbi:MAG: helix-turn-helix domain-containing protein, partial [Rubrivivax sp.]
MSQQNIEACVRASLEQYFRDLRGAEPHGVHDMILDAVEKPLLEVVLRHAQGNQSLAAQWLGI